MDYLLFVGTRLRSQRTGVAALFLTACLLLLTSSPAQAIIGGEEIKDSVFFRNFSSVLVVRPVGNLRCGGVLIDDHLFLTAAHCLDGFKPEGMRVHGASAILQEGGAEAKVTAYYLHPYYSPAGDGYDIALGVLDRSLPGAKPAQLVTHIGQRKDPYREGNQATIVGWGITENGTYSRRIRRLELPIVSNAIAQKNFPRRITNADACIAPPDQSARGACKGDSGSPVFIRDKDGKYIVVGVFCLVQCDQRGRITAGSPSVFVRITAVADWIEKLRTETESVRKSTGLMSHDGVQYVVQGDDAQRSASIGHEHNMAAFSTHVKQ